MPDPEVLEFCRRIMAGEYSLKTPVLIPERYKYKSFIQAIRKNLPTGFCGFARDGRNDRIIWVIKL